MKDIVLIGLVIAMQFADYAHAKPQDEKQRCERVKEKIKNVESRMRAGYSASQGIRLERRLRELKKDRYRYCR